MSPPPDPTGSVVCQELLFASKTVEAVVAVGESEITASGTATPNAELVTLAWFTCNIAPCGPRPLTLKLLLNQSVVPAGIEAPLKFAVMLLTLGVMRSSRLSRRGRRFSALG
jgi:hypothetical protein